MTSNGNDYSDVLICTNPTSFEKRRNITGEIWLQLGSFGFPSQSWSDFPVIILSWWLEALVSLRTTGYAEFLFMDGPLLFEGVDAEGNCFLRCMERTPDGQKCIREALVDVNELYSQITNAARMVVQECRQRGWVTADTAALESKVDALVPQSA